MSESKDVGSSRSYAISLYEEVARVHGKLIIPQIGRVMKTVTRSLSASGSSPQLHQACAKVAAALVRHSIDSDSTPAEAEDIVKEVSRPLVDLLTGNISLNIEIYCVLVGSGVRVLEVYMIFYRLALHA